MNTISHSPIWIPSSSTYLSLGVSVNSAIVNRDFSAKANLAHRLTILPNRVRVSLKGTKNGHTQGYNH